MEVLNEADNRISRLPQIHTGLLRLAQKNIRVLVARILQAGRVCIAVVPQARL